MIIIRTCKINKATGQPLYKEYYCTTGIKAGMSELNEDRRHNDVTVYTPTEIVDVWDNDDSRETRHHDCPFCGKQWREYCDDDNYPNYCPGCGEELRDREYDDAKKNEYLKVLNWLNDFCCRMEKSGLPNMPKDDRDGLLSANLHLQNLLKKVEETDDFLTLHNLI